MPQPGEARAFVTQEPPWRASWRGMRRRIDGPSCAGELERGRLPDARRASGNQNRLGYFRRILPVTHAPLLLFRFQKRG